MSEKNVRPVLFKHAFWGHVITETVAGICTLIIALLVQQFVGHRVLGWETVVILVLSVVVFSLLSTCLLYTSPSPRDKRQSRMPSSA